MLEQRATSAIDLNSVARLLTSNEKLARGKFQDNDAIPTDAIVKHTFEKLATKLATGQVRIHSQNGPNERLSGAVLVENSDWDSRHFGVTIGRLSLIVFDPETDLALRRALLLRVLASESFRMLSVRVNLADMATVQALEQEGGMLTDILLTFHFNSSWTLPAFFNDGVRITEALPTDHEILVRKAQKLFKIDRFHSDPNLAGAKSDQLYSKWVFNSLNGLADVTFVARKKDEPVGFITCKVERIARDFNYGIIDLVGVDPAEGGRGVGASLVRSALEWFAPKVSSVYVGTQAANNRAVKLYERIGFRHACSEATLHVWRS